MIGMTGTLSFQVLAQAFSIVVSQNYLIALAPYPQKMMRMIPGLEYNAGPVLLSAVALDLVTSKQGVKLVISWWARMKPGRYYR